MKIQIIFICLFACSVQPTGFVILLNGTSSAGKSSIAVCLQQKISASIVVSLDELFWSNMIRIAEQLEVVDLDMSYEQKYMVIQNHKKQVYQELKK